jgi:hypothetical protein
MWRACFKNPIWILFREKSQKIDAFALAVGAQADNCSEPGCTPAQVSSLSPFLRSLLLTSFGHNIILCVSITKSSHKVLITHK